MGRTLRRRLTRAGLGEVTATPLTLSFTAPESAAVVLPMVNPMVPEDAGCGRTAYARTGSPTCSVPAPGVNSWPF